MSDKLRNLIVRTVSGAVLLAVVFAAAWYGMITYKILLLGIALVGVEEFYRLAARRGAEPQTIMGLIATIAFLNSGFLLYYIIYDSGCCATTCVWNFIAPLLLVFVIFGVFVIEVFRNRPTPIFNIAATLMGVIYVALPMTIMLFIPAMLKGDGATWSPWYFLWYLFLVWGNDVFAYLTGVCFGKHKMCPRLSPKKSWEGFAGGVAGSLSMGALAAYFLDGNYVMWVGLALVVSLSSVVGDLAESMFKREAEVKDSGNIMPGHGGMLDRFDALLISAPFALVYIAIFNAVCTIA
jgi:phosphatidate cytidylyltransferase